MGLNFVKGRLKNDFSVFQTAFARNTPQFFADERSGRLCVSLFFARCGGATV